MRRCLAARGAEVREHLAGEPQGHLLLAGRLLHPAAPRQHAQEVRRQPFRGGTKAAHILARQLADHTNPTFPPSQRGPGGVAVIRVKDTGIGVPADQLPRIFDMLPWCSSA